MRKTLVLPLGMAAAMFLAPLGMVNAAVLVTDLVESHTNYTPSATGTRTTFNGLTPVSGTNFVDLSNNSGNAQSGSIYLTSGFGSSYLLAAGTYTLTVYVGEAQYTLQASPTSSNSRRTFTTFVPFLKTTSGSVELSGKTISTPYVDPASPSTAEWVQTVVQYEIPTDSALIGQEFTWGFDWTKSQSIFPGTAVNSGFYGAFDKASVDFAAVPEPTTFFLSSFGLLLLLRRRR